MTRADTWWMRSEKRPVGHRQKLYLTSLMSSPRLELRLLTGVSRDCLPPCVGPLNLCAAVMREECWAGGGRAKFFFTRKRGASSTFRMKFAVPSPSRLELRKAPRGGGPWLSFFLFQEPCPHLFLSHALPAAGCDSKLSLGSGVQSSELSRQSLAYPGPTEINLAWSVRNRGCPGPARFGNCKRVGDQSL